MASSPECVAGNRDSFSSFFAKAHRVVRSSGQPNYLSIHLPVPSRLNVQMWHDLLQDYPDNIICDFLEFGWPLGH